MATRRWGYEPDEPPHGVTEEVGAAVAAKPIEVTIDLAAGLTRNQVLQGLRKIERRIAEGDWPPA